MSEPTDRRPQPDAKSDLVPPETPRSFKPGEESGYQTDTFSRNDREGRPAADEAETEGGGPSRVEATPDARRRKPGDDPESRDATPSRPNEGGVR